MGQKRTLKSDLADLVQQTSIWKSKEITMRTKVKLYNSVGKSVFLYGLMPQENMQLHLGEKISNIVLYQRTGCGSVVQEIHESHLRWLGHVLSMPEMKTPKMALHWTPPRKSIQDHGRELCLKD